MNSAKFFAEYLRLLPALATSLAAVPWFWHDPQHSREERTIAVLFAVAACFLLWPWDFADCTKQGEYLKAFVICVICWSTGFVAERWIRGTLGYTQLSQTPDGEVSHKVIGGLVHTAAAEEVMRQNASWDDQDLLNHFGYKTDRVWTKASRTPITLAYSLAQVCKAAGGVLFPLAALVYFLFGFQTRHLHSTLQIAPRAEQYVSPGGNRTFFTNQRPCDPPVVWKLKGPAEEDLGKVADGFYTAPGKPVDVTIVAEAGGEADSVVVHVVLLPSDVTQYRTQVRDSDNRLVALEPVVLDSSHAWHIGEYFLDGGSGQDIINDLAARHVFDQYEDIVCIGAASRELLSSKKHQDALQEEEGRASERASVLAGWVAKAVPHSRFHIHALRIGRYDAEVRLSPQETAAERLVVLIGLKRLPGRIDMVSALREAFETLRPQNELFGTYLDHYPASGWAVIPTVGLSSAPHK